MAGGGRGRGGASVGGLGVWGRRWRLGEQPGAEGVMMTALWGGVVSCPSS